MIYVLKGWYKTSSRRRHPYLSGGKLLDTPPRIKDAVRGYSDDCELLEIVLPAGFGTVELDRL